MRYPNKKKNQKLIKHRSSIFSMMSNHFAWFMLGSHVARNRQKNIKARVMRWKGKFVVPSHRKCSRGPGRIAIKIYRRWRHVLPPLASCFSAFFIVNGRRGGKSHDNMYAFLRSPFFAQLIHKIGFYRDAIVHWMTQERLPSSLSRRWWLIHIATNYVMDFRSLSATSDHHLLLAFIFLSAHTFSPSVGRFMMLTRLFFKRNGGL